MAGFLLLVAMILAGGSVAAGQRVVDIDISGCPAAGTDSLPPADARPTDFVELQRTICYGPCPVYRVQVHANGEVTWEGEQYVRITGDRAATIKPSDARALIDKFRTARFWGLCADYDSRFPDGSTVITTVHAGDRVKQVSNNANSAPAWLKPLEDEIDAVADTHQWIHGDPRTETLAFVRLPGPIVGFPLEFLPGLGADARGPKPGLTSLMQAAAEGDVREISQQLLANADPNAQDASGWTALMYASRPDQRPLAEAIKLLLDSGANPHVRSYMGQTALMAVSNAFYAAPETVRLLLAARADANVQDNEGHTALMFAMYGSLGNSDTAPGFLERAELISLLLEAGARTDLVDMSGQTVFDYLDQDASSYPHRRSGADKLRQILQNPTPGTSPPANVRGRVVVTSGAPLWASTIEFQRVGVGAPTVRTSISTDGSFQFPLVQPGLHTVTLAPDLSFPLPAISLLIPNKDVTGLEIPIPAIKDVSVRVAVEGDLPGPNFGLVFIAASGPGSRGGPPTSVPALLAAVLPDNIRTAFFGGTAAWQLIRLGANPMVNDVALRIALPSPGSDRNVSAYDPLSDGSFRLTLPAGDYHVAAILPGLGRPPRLYSVKSLTSGSTNLLSEPLKIAGTEPIEIRATFETTSGTPWLKISGRVPGIPFGDEDNISVILSGDIIATISASVARDGSFEFSKVPPGRYILRVVPRDMESSAARLPLGRSDNEIRVTDKDVTGIEIPWKPR